MDQLDREMPEPVLSTSLIMAGYTAATALSRQGSAVSPEAETVRQNASSLVVQTEKSVALFGPKAAAISDLAMLANECSEPNWDGYAAEPVLPAALDLAQQIIRSLPEDISLPSLSVEPDGCVSLDWMPTRYRIFTLSASRRTASAARRYSWLAWVQHRPRLWQSEAKRTSGSYRSASRTADKVLGSIKQVNLNIFAELVG